MVFVGDISIVKGFITNLSVFWGCLLRCEEYSYVVFRSGFLWRRKSKNLSIQDAKMVVEEAAKKILSKDCMLSGGCSGWCWGLLYN